MLSNSGNKTQPEETFFHIEYKVDWPVDLLLDENALSK